MHAHSHVPNLHTRIHTLIIYTAFTQQSITTRQHFADYPVHSINIYTIMSDLEAEVKQLKEQVKKLQILLAKTGEQVMEMQMNNRKNSINDIQTKTNDLHQMVPASKPPVAMSDYVVGSDLNDMVGELQGQLDLLDQRSIRRTLNSRSKSKLEAIPNSDGEDHPLFPKTIESLQKLTDAELFDQWNHFEMLSGETLDDLLEKGDSEEVIAGNKKVIQEIYDSFARNVGLDPVEYPRK